MRFSYYLIVVSFLHLQLLGANHSFIMENDALTGTDRHYTNGLFYTYMQDTSSVPSWLDISNASQKDESYTLSQLMYTPDDLSKSEKQTDDLPYAGYLSLNYSIFQSTSNYFHEFGINIGVVGPLSRAEEVQKNVHKLNGNREPQGWHNQLGNQGTAGIAYQFAIKTNKIDMGDYKFDWLGNFRIDRGNFYSGALIGTTIRFGSDIPKNFYTGGNLVGGNESTLLNLSKSNDLIWHFAWGINFNSIRKFYIVDAAHEYTVEGIDYTVEKHFSTNIQYGSTEFSLILKSTYMNNLKFEEDTLAKWGGIQIKWQL